MEDKFGRIQLPRRSFLKSASALALAPLISFLPFPTATANSASSILTKSIPATNEMIPIIGMGSWLTFSVGGNTFTMDASGFKGDKDAEFDDVSVATHKHSITGSPPLPI